MDKEVNFNDDELEILDFSIDNEPPKEINEDVEILDFDDEIEETIDFYEDNIDKSSKQEIQPEIEIIDIVDNISSISNNSISTEEQPKEEVNINDEVIDSISNELENTLNRIILTEEQPQIKNSDILNNNFNIGKDEKQATVVTHKRKLKLKSVFIGLLILIILVSVIIFLPKINEYVNNNAIQNENIEKNTNNESYKSNIDVKSVLTKIKDYKNYKYQNTNDILTKDKNNNPLTIKSSYSYLFNETKLSVEINKEVADFSYVSKDYYEKLDDVYNLYVNDITTNTYTKKTSTVEEFESLQNIYPNVINYLIDNYKIVDETLISTSDGNKISINLKVPVEILNYLSLKNDRIQNNIDISKATITHINVELLFSTDKKIEKISFEVEDKALYHEELDSEVESSLLKYSFTELNKIEDISLPLQ